MPRSRERGYSGGYTMLEVSVASLKPPEAAEPVIRFETEPGEQMQVDESARTTKLYDRRSDRITLDELEKIIL